MFIQPKSTVVSEPQTILYPIKQFAGINQLADPSQIGDNETPDCQNVQTDNLLALEKRSGYGKMWLNSLGSGQINGVYNGTFNGYIIFTWGTALYKKLVGDTSQPISIMTGLANAKSYFFTFPRLSDGVLCVWMSNGTDFICYDGANAVTVESFAYVPTITLGRSKTGGGTSYQRVNILQPAVIDSFSPDGTSTTYPCSFTNLDASPPMTASIDGGVTWNKVETTDFTVNRTTGVVTFTVAPTAGTNTLLIKSYKTVPGSASKIKSNSVQPAIFGGDNDTRVFFANGNTRYHSGLLDASYWPDLNYSQVGSSATNITGFSSQIDTQIILKQHKNNENAIYSSIYNMDSSGNVTFPVSPRNNIAGADVGGSIQVIDNNPTFCDTENGVYELTTSNVRDQRIVTRISDKINKSLLQETNLTSAVSFLWNFKYGLCVNGNVYLYDYRQQLWFKWTNINASCFFTIGTTLYFGSNSIGMIYQFNGKYNDDGVAINAYWKSKQLNYNLDVYKKLLSRLFYGVKPNSRSSATVSFVTNTNSVPTVLNPTRRDLFDYSLIDYSKWTYASSNFPQESMRKVRVKKIMWIQFTISNNNIDESMGIINFTSQVTESNLSKDS